MIELEQARQLLQQAVETQGRDFVYNEEENGICFYEPRDGWGEAKKITGCLIGTALTIAGETRHLKHRDNVIAMHYEYDSMLSLDATYYFQDAQHAQDAGCTWGEALDAAEASLTSAKHEQPKHRLTT